MNNSTINGTNSIRQAWLRFLHPDLITLAPDYWLNFEPISCQVNLTIAAIFTVVLIIGLTGNLTIIYLYCRVKALRNGRNTISLNIAVSDLIMNGVIAAYVYNSTQCGSALTPLGCKLYGFAGGLSGTVTIMSITAVTFERYLTINHQNFSQPYFDYRGSIVLIILLWLYSFMFTIPPIFGFFNNYIPEGHLTTCSFDYVSTKFESRLFVFIFFLGAWVIPSIIIIGSYVGIYRATHRSSARFETYATKSVPSPTLNDHHSNNPSQHHSSNRNGTNIYNENSSNNSNSSGTNNPTNGNINNNIMIQQRTQHRIRLEHRLVRTSMALITLWMITWTPYAVVSLIGIINPLLLTPTMAMLPAMFAKTSAVMDPFVYGYLHPRIKFEVKKRFFNCCVKSFQRSSSLRSSLPSKTSTSSNRWQKIAKF
ncbi:rhodopsin-like [Panonychus citri]|uniref:rhodopsin-like n=1 Tax=Panonychus citri TaxID=50023 RepID=UPI002307DA05|nr:rhodopsin-like [Panonychus citri]